MKIVLNDSLEAKDINAPLREAIKALQRENAELREALEHPSYEEENRLRAEVDRMRAEVKDRNEVIAMLQNELRNYRKREKTMGWNND